MLTEIITSPDPAIRDRSLDAWARDATTAELLAACEELDPFRRTCPNLYERVRALFLLHALHRYHLRGRPDVAARGHIPADGVAALFDRRFDDALGRFFEQQAADGANEAISSALAQAYHGLGFETLAAQVRRSVRAAEGNGWMFEPLRAAEHPHPIRAELTGPGHAVLVERTPVRMDFTHSGWSDIFFLGMDFPEGARVINTSIDLGVWGRDDATAPPIETRLRVIDRPVLVVESTDLGARAEIETLEEVFDFARDHLGLLKAGVIAAGLVPPALEGSGETLGALLERLCGPGRGLEVTSFVRGIPKGSRLAVSTNLLASMIAAGMRATSQIGLLEGELTEDERRVVAARAILGEWLGGSGGGWQDSGGLWPGIKLIRGEVAREGDPEHGISRGRLLPRHEVLGGDALAPGVLDDLQRSLVLVHGGMAQDVGPILEMVTESYLVRGEREWAARTDALAILDEVLAALRKGDVRAVGAATTRNFEGPIRAIVPWATNAFTEELIAASRERFGDAFWGFWMLGGMAGGGMGFLFEPERRDEARTWLAERMLATKAELERGVPFAMDPVVYEFRVNERGSVGALAGPGEERPAAIPSEGGSKSGDATTSSLDELLAANGFDRDAHEGIRRDVRSGVLGLARNRLPAHTVLEDVGPSEVISADDEDVYAYEEIGRRLLREGRVAVVTLAAGSGSRWTRGAGVVKGLNPFARFGPRHRTFLEVHLAKSRRASRRYSALVPHVFTTSYLTHDPLERHLAARENYGYEGPVLLSRGRSVGLRLVPMERDLRFAWEELTQERLEEQAQKVRESLQSALIAWARDVGEGTDYTENDPLQCLHPVGHWSEIPNLIRNGTLSALLRERPNLEHLLVHNIDTLGADVEPALLGRHAAERACLSFEVLPRHVEDSGGGLARVDGRVRIVEGLALPREEEEWRLSWYNSMTTWVNVDRLLAVFGLRRDALDDAARVDEAVARVARRMPTYVTIKDVKRRWGHGQEDVFPVAQWERLWSDMSALPGLACRYFAVRRVRGQQLKDVAQLDGWLRDGSQAFVDGLCDFDDGPERGSR